MGSDKITQYWQALNDFQELIREEDVKPYASSKLNAPLFNHYAFQWAENKKKKN